MLDVLLVDDDELFRQQIKNICANRPELNLNIRWECVNVREASAVLGQFPDEIRLMLMDSEMEGHKTQGMDFLLQLRLLKVSLPPTILISNHIDFGTLPDEAGVRYITKPVTEGRFATVVTELLGIRKNDSIDFRTIIDGVAGQRRVLLRDIVMLKSDNPNEHDGVKILTADGEEILVKASKHNLAPVHKLVYYTEAYPEFIKVSVGTVVNLAWVLMLVHGNKSLLLRTSPARKVEIGEFFSEAFHRAWQTYR